MHWKSLRSRFFLTSLFLSLLGVSAEAGKYSSGGGRSYSSGGSSSRSSGSSSSFGSSSSRPSSGSSSSFSRPSTPAPSPTPSRPSTPSYSSQRSSYSSGTSPATSSSFSRPAPSPSGPSIDTAAAKAKQVQQSTQNFAQSRPTPAPAPTSSANSRPAAAPSYSSAPRPQSLPPMPPRSSYASRAYANTSNLSGGSTTTRVVHHYPAFSSYYSRPVVIYQDSYSSPFWYWLLDQPRPVRAAWYYHHRSDMDPARQTALVAADPALTQEVAQVATAAPTPDPTYVPPGIEPQAMTAAVETIEVPAEENPLPASGNTLNVIPVTPAAPAPMSSPLPVSHQNVPHSRGSSILSSFILIGGGIFVLWLVFFKRWKPASA